MYVIKMICPARAGIETHACARARTHTHTHNTHTHARTHEASIDHVDHLWQRQADIDLVFGEVQDAPKRAHIFLIYRQVKYEHDIHKETKHALEMMRKSQKYIHTILQRTRPAQQIQASYLGSIRSRTAARRACINATVLAAAALATAGSRVPSTSVMVLGDAA